MDYFEGHLSVVASLGRTWQEKVVGYLHDASEDTPHSVEQVLELVEDEAHVETAPILLRDGVRAADLHSQGDAVRWSDRTDSTKHLRTVFLHRRQVL